MNLDRFTVTCDQRVNEDIADTKLLRMNLSFDVESFMGQRILELARQGVFMIDENNYIYPNPEYTNEPSK